MKIIFNLTTLLFVSFMLILSISAQDRVYSINTVAGKVSVSSTAGEMNCVIKLGKKVMRTFECDYSPRVLKHIKQSISPFDEVIVFQETTTAQVCDGQDVFFLGLNKNGTYKFSDSIEYCGGRKPLVNFVNGKITVTFPTFKAFSGGVVRKQIWSYQNGEILQIKRTRSLAQ